jgi:hypothetical protein
MILQYVLFAGRIGREYNNRRYCAAEQALVEA